MVPSQILCVTLAFLNLLLVERVLPLPTSGQTCGPPPEVPKSTASVSKGNVFSLDTKVTYTCNFGYVPNRGRIYTICKLEPESNATKWTTVESSCIPRSCGDPGFLPNGERDGAVFVFPNSVTYSCNDGYNLVGTRQRFCLTSGVWSGNLPSCEKLRCNVPTNPESGRVIYDSLEFGSEVLYECDKGYQLSTARKRSCSSDGQWSGSEPVCVESTCPYPQAPRHGSVELVGGQHRAGSVVLYQCEPGRILDGSRTAKCLNSGEWTFPPPECLTACKIPSVENGKIGKYAKRYGMWKFDGISVGAEIGRGEEVYVRCDAKQYEALGRPGIEAIVSCSNGKWTHYPECKLAICREPPPTVPNAILKTKEITHGTSLSYDCKDYFKKSKWGGTKCLYGKWNINLPICKDSRCYVDSLKYDGTLPSVEIFVLDGSYYNPNCEEGYVVNSNFKIRCEFGVWQSTRGFPCKPANCNDKPPSLENGQVHSTTGIHGTSASYSCNSNYYFSSTFVVKCEFGKWIGQPSSCIDSSCYVEDLTSASGVNTTISVPTRSGTDGYIVCQEGFYYSSEYVPRCIERKWHNNNYSPCQPLPCKVSEIADGKMQYISEFTGLYRDLEINSSHENGTKVYVFCNKPYTFQGKKNVQRQNVQCNRGKWMPTPLCLYRARDTSSPNNEEEVIVSKKNGISSTTQSQFHITTENDRWEGQDSSTSSPTHRHSTVEHSTTLEATIFNDSVITKTTEDEILTHLTRSSPSGFHASSESDNSSDLLPEIEKVTTVPFVSNRSDLSGNKISIPNTNTTQQCSCVYSLKDDNVIAYTEERIIKYGSHIKKGCTIKFRCLHLGYHRLYGITELECTGKCAWHSSMFPTCRNPRNEDATFSVTAPRANIYITPNGTIQIPLHASLTITCATALNKWPTLDGPRSVYIFPIYEMESYRDHDILTLKFHIVKMNSSYNGRYICSVINGYPTAFEMEVKEYLCPVLQLDQSVDVAYSKEREISSVAEFKCLGAFSVLEGPRSITCLSNVRWSAAPPTCKYIECPTLPHNGSLAVLYNPNRRVGSSATFHCALPFTRQGVASAKCLQNGTWSDESPICIESLCPVLQLDDLAVIYSNERQVNSVAEFKCLETFSVLEGPQRITCLSSLEWSESPPKCRSPECSMESLMDKLPEEVIPMEEDVTEETFPYLTVVRLQCSREYNKLIGSTSVSCGQAGSWVIGSMECVLACDPVVVLDDSGLEVVPLKEFYRFGEFVTFSCQPGQVLNTTVERIICLGNDWSQSVIPICINS